MNTNYSDFEKLYSAKGFHENGTLLLSELTNYLKKTAESTSPALSFIEPEEMLRYWQSWNDNTRHLSESERIQKFCTDLLSYTNHLQNPKYIGHQVSAPLPIASLMMLIGGISNNGSAVYEMGMAPTAMERIVTDKLCTKFEWDSNSGGFLTSGGTLANLTSLLAARKFKATEDIWNEGMQKPLAILVSSQAHYCIDRAARIMGLGADGIISIEVDENLCADESAIEKAYQSALVKGREVIAVVGSAPSTSTGNYDNLDALGRFANDKGIWFHIDAAHGGAAIFSGKYKYLLKGSERADSIIIDGHKMMLMPALSTAVLFKNKNHAYENFNQRAAYLLEDSVEEDWYNGAKKTFECTKTMMVLPWFILLNLYGESLFETYIDRQYDLARAFAEEINRAEDFETPARVDSNIVCFRYQFNENINAQNQQLRSYLLKHSDYYIVQTHLDGSHYLRVSLMNPLTEL
ncbi:MAG: pyridoxal phosphate-dependent decarboxylase family protein, partial [Flavobacteriaceae bacterium]